MSEVFLKVLNMSISASWIVLVVLLLRLLLKKAPRWITVLLWGIVAVRLICPVTIESVLSLIPSAETVSPDIMMDWTPQIDTGIPVLNNAVNPVISGSFAPSPMASANPLQIWIPVFSVFWLAGMALMLLYTLISCWRVKRKVRTAVLLRENIYQSDAVGSPFVFGVIKPKIYLPMQMNEQDMELVIAHEQAHIRRKDHLWKPLGFLILTLHWFNPLLWLGYVLLCRDIELACDEKVIKELDTEQKADYSQALLTCSVNRHTIAACPLAFGEVGVKERIKAVFHYKKPAFWLVAVAIVVCIVAAVCFLTNPASDTLINIEDYTLNSLQEETVAVWTSNGEAYHSVGTVDQDILQQLSEIRISRKEISLNRGEDRDKSYTLVLQSEEDAAPTIDSYLKGLYIHFNSDFTSVWMNDGVKPTLSYKVMEPNKAKEVYNLFGQVKEIDEMIPQSDITAVVDQISFDIDGDGEKEQCILTPGPTSGLFSFAVSVYDQKGLEYYNVFTGPWMQMHFEGEAGGDLRLVGDQGVLNLKVKEGNILISGIVSITEDMEYGYWGEQGVESPYAPVTQIKTTYEATGTDVLTYYYNSEQFVTTKTYYELEDGSWMANGYSYKYRLEVTGRTNNAAKNTTYVILSNKQNITFGEAWRASGLSSDMDDYFDPADAVIVGHRLFE